jgi:hypothetical protein
MAAAALLDLSAFPWRALRQIKISRIGFAAGLTAQSRLAIIRSVRHMTRTARPRWARAFKSDGKDYRADYEHDELSPINLKTPDAFSGDRTAM